jgi:hypothetical protein
MPPAGWGNHFPCTPGLPVADFSGNRPDRVREQSRQFSGSGLSSAKRSTMTLENGVGFIAFIGASTL